MTSQPYSAGTLVTGSIRCATEYLSSFMQAANNYSVKILRGEKVAYTQYLGGYYIVSDDTDYIYTVINQLPTRYAAFKKWSQMSLHSSGSYYMKSFSNPGTSQSSYEFLIKTDSSAQVICSVENNTGAKHLLASPASGKLWYFRVCHECYGGCDWYVRCWNVTDDTFSTSSAISHTFGFDLCYYNNLSSVPTTYRADVLGSSVFA